MRLAIGVLERDREDDVRVRRVSGKRDIDKFIERQRVLRDGLFGAVHEDRDLFLFSHGSYPFPASIGRCDAGLAYLQSYTAAQ